MAKLQDVFPVVKYAPVGLNLTTARCQCCASSNGMARFTEPLHHGEPLAIPAVGPGDLKQVDMPHWTNKVLAAFRVVWQAKA